LIALLILLVVGIYAISIVAGRIPADRKLVGPDIVILLLGVLVSVILWQPKLLDRLTHLKLGGLEVELERLQENQKAQQFELNHLRFVLTLLLQDGEREHLKNLKSGDTQNYTGNHQLRTELRRLKAMGLVAKLPDRNVADIKDGQKVDLKTVVQLTERGNQYLEKIAETE
jgi:hypothetical protein